MAGANGKSSKSGPMRAKARMAASPAGASSSGSAADARGRSGAIERMRAAAQLINNGSPAEQARGERAFGAAIRKLRASRASRSAAPKATAAKASAVTKPAMSAAPKAKPVVQHGQMQLHANKDGTYSLRHAASGREISGGLTKAYGKQLTSYFGRGAGVEQMRKAVMGDAKAKSWVDNWLADGRRRSAPKLARAS